MSMHVTTGRWRLGLGLSLITAFLWGVLPIALKMVLESMDVVTITWYRYLVAAILLFPFVLHRNGIRAMKQVKGKWIGLLVVAVFGLSGNYLLFLFGLRFLTPSSAQVVIQLSPMLFLVGSIFLFKERFAAVQWVGFVLFFVGMGLFFNNRLYELFVHRTTYSLGIFLIVVAAMFWTAYALAQKQLLRVLSSETIMLLLYTGGVLFLLPRIHPMQVFQMSRTEIFVLFFCALNTLFAYGSFAEALDHWEASRVSAVITVVPLITLSATKIGSALFPKSIASEPLNGLSVFGAVLVVVGSMVAALGKNRALPPETVQKL